MRCIFLSVLVCTAAIAPAVAQSPLTEGQKAFAMGDDQTARVKFEAVLAAQPENAVARNYLWMMRMAEAQVPLAARLDRQIQTLVLPKVEVNEATLESVLEALQQEVAVVSGGKTQANFVLMPGIDPMAKVTLHLSAIPFAEVLRYLGDLLGAKVVAERYAICIGPQSETPMPPTLVQIYGPPVGVSLGRELQRLILPKVNFKEASLSSALDALEQQAAKLTGGAVQARFVLKPEVKVAAPVTLRLADVPFTEALRCLGDVASLNFTIDRYAVAVAAKPSPTPAAPAPTAPVIPGL